MVTSIGALGALLASLTDPRNWTIPAASRAGSHPVRCGGDPATGHVLAATRFPSITASCSWPTSGAGASYPQKIQVGSRSIPAGSRQHAVTR